MLTSLLYISRSLIDPQTAEAEVKAIVAVAVIANRERGLTGALLFTGTHFAQVIEGRDEDIDVLLSSLSQDRRHEQLQIVDRTPLAERRFDDWSMAYFGPSKFVSRHVTRLLNNPSPSERSRAVGWLTELMNEFVGT